MVSCKLQSCPGDSSDVYEWIHLVSIAHKVIIYYEDQFSRLFRGSSDVVNDSSHHDAVRHLNIYRIVHYQNFGTPYLDFERIQRDASELVALLRTEYPNISSTLLMYAMACAVMSCAEEVAKGMRAVFSVK